MLKEVFSSEWDKFQDFMYGQTMALYKGEGVVYECDVENYLYYKKKGKVLFFD